ncbi:MAG TPA: pitrilysin family protein [Kofleriaceae bacterium]|nr:pitrilysin family protein [Kofleriaceae bacterium]
MRSLLWSSCVLAAVAGTAVAAPNPAFEKSGISDWNKTPPPTKEPAFKPPVAKRMKLKNGMALLVVENHKLPIVAMTLVVPGAGAAADPADKGGLAAFTADLLDEGAGGLSALGIAEEQDRLGASIGIGADVDAAMVSATTLAKTLDPTLDLLAKVLTQPTFDAKEFERVKGDRVTALELRRDRPREVAAIMLNAALYGAKSAYGHPAAGVREQFKSIAIADVQAFYKERWNPAAMTLVVAGDVDTAALRKKLDAGIGAWKPAGVKPAGKVVATPEKVGKRLLLADRPGAAQSDVRVGLVGLDRKDKRYFAFEVLRTTLGDGFTSRLTQKLREEMGITYGAGAIQSWRLQPGPFLIATAIQTPDTGRGLTEIVHILDDLATNDVPAAELEKSKQNIIRALPSMFDTNAGTAGAFADLALHGLPDTYYATYAAQIRRITAKDVKAVAKAVIPSSRMAFSIVGDLSKIRADLDKLGLGEAAMHDLYGVPQAK